MKIWQTSLILCSFLLASCAIGNQYTYDGTLANITASGDISVATATHDQRSYVVQGKNEPNYVGVMRGGFGNTFDITTQSGKTLANDMTTSISNSLKVRGYKAVAVAVSHTDNRDNVIKMLREQKSTRLLLLSLYEWQSDTYTNTGLFYDIKLEVFDAEGNKLTEKSSKGEDTLGGSFMNPPAFAKEAVPKAFKEKLEALINNDDVLKALR